MKAFIRSRLLEDFQVLVFGSLSASLCVSSAAVGSLLFEELEVPVYGSHNARLYILGHLCACAYWRTFRCLLQAAPVHVKMSQRHPWARLRLKDLDVPVPDSHCARVFVPGVALCRAHWRTARCPPSAEKAHRCPLNLSRTDPSRTPSTNLSRATLAAASAPCVRVTFPAGGAPPPARHTHTVTTYCYDIHILYVMYSIQSMDSKLCTFVHVYMLHSIFGIQNCKMDRQ